MNVVLITIDTCRPQLFRFANEFAHPNQSNIIDDLFVEDGLVFLNSIGNATSTFPAHGAIFTGKLPQNNRISWGLTKYDDDTIFDTFNNNGYKTYLYGNGIAGVYPYLQDRKSIELLCDPPELTHGALLRKKPLTYAEESLKIFKQHLDKIEYSKDFLLFTHFWDCHLPLVDEHYNIYVGYGGFKTRSLVWENRVHDFEKMQKAALINVVCAKIQLLVDKLKEVDKFDDTLFVIQNDHSESFFKRRPFHFDPCKDCINTFLIFYGPDVQRNQSLYRAQQIDILPTIIDYVGLSNDSDFDGVSLRNQSVKQEEQPRDVLGVHFNYGKPTYLVTNYKGVDYLYSNTPSDIIRADMNAAEEDGMEENEQLPERVKRQRRAQREQLKRRMQEVSYTEEIVLYDDHECNNLLESTSWLKQNVGLVKEIRSKIEPYNEQFEASQKIRNDEAEQQLEALGYM